MSPFGCVAVACVGALLGGWLLQLRRHRREIRRQAYVDAAVRAQALAYSIPERPVQYRGASRDRSRPGKARRQERRG